MSGAVLVVDDEPVTRHLVTRMLQSAGYVVVSATTAAEAESVVASGFVGVIVLDVQLPDETGPEVFPRLQKLGPQNPVIFLTSHRSAALALDSIQGGALDCIDKADLRTRLLPTVERAQELSLKREMPTNIISCADNMKPVFRAISQVRDSSVPVLILGESGTG